MTTNNITNATVTINNYSSTYHTLEPTDTLLDNSSSSVSIPTKACNKCHQIKELIEFPKEKRSHNGYRNQCKNYFNNRNKNIIIRLKIKYYSIIKNIAN